MIRADAPAAVVELERSIDLVELVGAARDAGQEVMLIERPMPDAVSIAGVGRRFDIVSTPHGAALEDGEGLVLDTTSSPDRVAAAAQLWHRLAQSEAADSAGPTGTGLVGLGGFAFDPSRDPVGAWAGFPALLFRVPMLAVTRVRGRTFATGDLSLLEQPAAGWSGPRARHFELEPARSEADWTAAVAEASQRLRAGAAAKVVLAREVTAHADGALSAGRVVRALRSAHPSCFTFLIAGADGTAFVGASPELLLRRSGRLVVSQPMAGTIRRGEDESEDEALADRLRTSAKDGAEHQLTARHVTDSLAECCEWVDRGQPEIVRLTTVQHLATTIRGHLLEPALSALEMAAAIHPTPAINGSPAAAARRLIDELECMERGWYGGAVGWLDGRGDGELAVAIRCGLLCQDGARLYAGNGMMPDSDPQAELEETEPKLRVLLGALTG